jgi:hypothetical protein
VVVAPLVLDLFPLLACLGALILILLARQLSSALFGIANTALGWIPWVGNKAKGELTRIDQRINNYMSQIVDGLQGKVGEYWHALGNLLASIGNEIVAGEDAFAKLAWYVLYKYPVHVIGAVAHRALADARHVLRQLEALTVRVEHAAQALSHPWTGPIASGVKAGTRALTGEIRAIDRWIGTRGRWLQHEVSVTLPRDIAGLRARDKSLERAYSRLWKQIRRLDKITAGTLFAGAVAIALGRLGAGWVRCGNWNRIGRTVCRTPFGDIEGLLALLATGAVIADFRELVKLAQSVEHGAAVVIQDIAKV